MLIKQSGWSVVLLSLVAVSCADAGPDHCDDGANCASDDDEVPLLAAQVYPGEGEASAIYAVASGGHIQAQASNPINCTEITNPRFPKLERSDCVLPGGTTLTLTAQPAPGFQFTFWECQGAQRSDNPITFADVTGDTRIACQAVFVPIRAQPPSGNLVVTGAAGDGGTVTLSTTNGSCSAGSCSVAPGADVTLTATASFGAVFTGWSGCSTSLADTITLASVRSNQGCTANFLRFF